MLIFVPKERRAGETRIAATAETVKRWVQQGFEVAVEPGAGTAAFVLDRELEAAGAKLRPFGDAWPKADIVAMVGPLEAKDAATLKESAVVIGLLAPYRSDETIRKILGGNMLRVLRANEA